MSTIATLRSCCGRSQARNIVSSSRLRLTTVHQQQQHRGLFSLSSKLSGLEQGFLKLGISSRSSLDRIGSARTFVAIESPYARPPGKRKVPQEQYDPDNERVFVEIDPDDSPYCVVDHGGAYEKAMSSYHGGTLRKAHEEGKGADAPLFDPFYEDEELERQLDAEEMVEARKMALARREAALARGEKIDEEVVDEERDEEDGDDDEEEDEEVDELQATDDMSEEEKKELMARIMYNPDGSIRRKASQKIILRAGAPAGGWFAIIEMAGTQFKVTNDDLLIVNRLKPQRVWSIGSIHELKEVLLVGSTHKTLVGMPYVPGATVTVMIEEITKDEKVVIFKKRRRKHSQRKRGFRRDITMLRVLDISFPDQYAEHAYMPRIQPDLLPPRDDPRLRFEDDEYDDEDDYEDEEEEENDSRTIEVGGK